MVGVDAQGNTTTYEYGNGPPPGVTPTAIELKINRPVYVSCSSTAGLNVSAQSGVNVFETDGNLTVGQISSASGAVDLAATGNIVTPDLVSVNGFGSNGTGWTTQTNATGSPTVASDVLTITTASGGEARAAWFNTPVSTGSFTASFTYTDVGGGGADGAAFVLQNDPQGTAAIGGSNGSFGYGGIAASVAYEISIWNGRTVGTNFVTDGTTGTYNTTTPINVASGDAIKVTLVYDAAAETLTEFLTDTKTGGVYTHTYTGIDLAATLGGSTALLGFTGGTGGGASLQTIGSFSFTPGITLAGFGSDGTGWTTQTNATGSPTIASDVLTITTASGGEARAASFNTPVSTGSFTASFTYTDVGGGGADGAAFVLQNDPQGTAAIGGSNGSFGYGGIAASVAYEISIWNGRTVGTNFVTDGTTGTYNTTTPINVASGDPIKVTLVYDATAETLTEFLADTTTGSVYTHTYTGIDLAATLGGSTALLGFTGGTGGGASLQTIGSFSFTSQSTIVTGNTLNLFAGGSVGTGLAPLVIGAVGTAPIVLDTSAKNGVYVTQPSGNLTVGQVSTSSGTASLSTASGNILEGPSGAINAPEITLTSAQGIGTSTLPLSVGIVGTAPNLVNASAQQGVYITQPTGDLTVGQVTSTGGPVHLTATTGNIVGLSSVQGFGSDGTGWTTQTNTTGSPVIAGNVLTLTNGLAGESAAAWSDTPVSTGSFKVDFTYTDVGGGGGDGVTFTLQNSPSGLNALGAAGGYLGYSGISPGVAYEINVYNGHVQGTNFVTDGTTETYNATGTVDVASGDPINVTLIYNAATGTLEEMLTDETTGASYTHLYSGINLSSVLGSATAYMGFTAGSGGAVLHPDHQQLRVQRLGVERLRRQWRRDGPGLLMEPAARSSPATCSLSRTVLATRPGPPGTIRRCPQAASRWISRTPMWAAAAVTVSHSHSRTARTASTPLAPPADTSVTAESVPALLMRSMSTTATFRGLTS